MKGGLTAGVIVIVLGLVGCVGVGVIGILAAIAIPNFLRFQCLSKQSEAKAELMSLYTAEKAFQAEYGFYTSDLGSLSWSPSGSPAYVYGFAEEGPAEEDLPRSVSEVPRDYDPSRKDTANTDVASSGFSTTRMVDTTGQPITGDELPGETWADASGFRAAAVGDIAPDGGIPRFDVWVVDQTGTVTNLENDCRN